MLKNEEKKQPTIVYPVKIISSENEGETKTFLDEEKLKEFVASKLVLNEWLNDIM